MLGFARELIKKLPPIRRIIDERNLLTAKLHEAGQEIRMLRHNAANWRGEPCYDADGMKLWGKNPGFLESKAFQRAYQLGMNSGHKIARAAGSTDDIHIEWRVHIACWAASHATLLEGDLVECGVNTGILSLAICDYINFNATNKHFYLFDTYEGIPESQMTEKEKAVRIDENKKMYESCYEVTKRNFSPFPNARLVRGMVPDTLTTVPINKVAYLSLDMNIAAPEIAAIEYFWPRLSSGAIVLLDDYGFANYPEQHEAMNRYAAKVNVPIATLPTGQGLIIKP